MKKKIYHLIIIILSLNSGCDDGFLDTAPYDGLSSSMIFNSDANAIMAMNGTYNALSRNAFGPDFYVFISAIGPEGYGIVRGNWGMSHSMGLGTSRDGQITNVYRNFYRPILYANEIISGLDKNNKVSTDLRNRLIGEAKFVRGLCYFYLYNLYGGVVILDKPTPVGETYLSRNSKEEVVQLCISDFSDAIDKLPISYPAADKGRVTKGAAIAMLGKTYLYEKQWANAASQFEKLLVAPYAYNLVANYGDNFYWKTQNNVETVFDIQYLMESGLGSTFDNWFGHRSMRNQGQDYCELSHRSFKAYTKNDGKPIDFSTLPKRNDYDTEINYGIGLTNWYQTTMSDVDKRLHQSAILPGSTFLGAGDKYHRLYWPYSPYINADPPAIRTTFTGDAIIPIRKFITLGQENSLGRTECPTNFPVVRYADVLLMYAEAKNEASGAIADVYNSIDKVRIRAGLVELSALKPNMTKDEMRREIWLERFRELMFESVLYFDVRRWNVAHTHDPVFGLNNEEWDFRYMTRFYTKVFNSTRDYLWPLPGGEIDLNNKITQNPGW
jgi:starch-binding outer membrane protein, SusD/RagB family